MPIDPDSLPVRTAAQRLAIVQWAIEKLVAGHQSVTHETGVSYTRASLKDLMDLEKKLAKSVALSRRRNRVLITKGFQFNPPSARGCY